MSGQRLAIIILATLFTALLLFCLVFVYYYKARDQVHRLVRTKGGLKMPQLPSLPRRMTGGSAGSVGGKVRGLCNLDNKLDRLTWPLSGISLGDKLPAFMKNNSSGVKTVTAAGGDKDKIPVPPPRARRSRPASPGGGRGGQSAYQPVAARLATIQPRSHPRPPGPPPSRPHVAGGGVPVLEISSPTEVTINGVTFSRESPMSQTSAAGPTPSSAGIICAARPAVVLSDVPDSSLETSMPPGGSGVPAAAAAGNRANTGGHHQKLSSYSKSTAPAPPAAAAIKAPHQPPPDLPSPSPRTNANLARPPPPPPLRSASPPPPSSSIPPPLPSCPPPDSLIEDLDNSTDA